MKEAELLRKLRVATITAAATASLLGSVITGMAPANASPKASTSGVAGGCFSGAGGSGFMCYYYLTNFNGADEGIANAYSDFNNPAVDFNNVNNNSVSMPSMGLGDPLKNNAKSGANFRTDCAAHIFSAKNFAGIELTLAADGNPNSTSTTLGALNDKDVSQNFC